MLAEKINRIKSKIAQLGTQQALGQMAPVMISDLEQAEELAIQIEAKLEVPNEAADLADHEVLMDARIALSELARSVGDSEWAKIKDITARLGLVQRNCARNIVAPVGAATSAAAQGGSANA